MEYQISRIPNKPSSPHKYKDLRPYAKRIIKHQQSAHRLRSTVSVVVECANQSAKVVTYYHYKLKCIMQISRLVG